jgi:hypothetical protein
MRSLKRDCEAALASGLQFAGAHSPDGRLNLCHMGTSKVLKPGRGEEFFARSQFKGFTEHAKAIGSPPARRHSGDRLRGKAKTRKRKAKKTPPSKYKSTRKHENKPGFTALFS